MSPKYVTTAGQGLIAELAAEAMRAETSILTARRAFSRDTRILLEIADGSEPKDVPPTLPAMLGCIMDHVAALT